MYGGSQHVVKPNENFPTKNEQHLVEQDLSETCGHVERNLSTYKEGMLSTNPVLVTETGCHETGGMQVSIPVEVAVGERWALGCDGTSRATSTTPTTPTLVFIGFRNSAPAIFVHGLSSWSSCCRRVRLSPP